MEIFTQQYRKNLYLNNNQIDLLNQLLKRDEKFYMQALMEGSKNSQISIGLAYALEIDSVIFYIGKNKHLIYQMCEANEIETIGFYENLKEFKKDSYMHKDAYSLIDKEYVSERKILCILDDLKPQKELSELIDNITFHNTESVKYRILFINLHPIGSAEEWLELFNVKNIEEENTAKRLSQIDFMNYWTIRNLSPRLGKKDIYKRIFNEFISPYLILS